MVIITKKGNGYNMNNNRKEMLYALNSITQLGLSVIISFLLWIFIAMWVKNKFNLGNFVMIIGILLGAGSAVLSFIKFCGLISPKGKNDEK